MPRIARLKDTNPHVSVIYSSSLLVVKPIPGVRIMFYLRNLRGKACDRLCIFSLLEDVTTREYYDSMKGLHC